MVNGARFVGIKADADRKVLIQEPTIWIGVWKRSGIVSHHQRGRQKMKNLACED